MLDRSPSEIIRLMDLSNSKLQQLVTVARTGSFSKAAADLNMSQPALSRSIAAIEEYYGFQIFNRVGHGVRLTAAGRQVVELAEPTLQTMQVFDSNLRLFGSGKIGTLSIGFAPLLASQFLARFAANFFASPSKVSLKVLIRPGAILLQSLKDDDIELFIFPEGYIEPAPDIEIEFLGKIDPLCVVRADHPLARSGNLSLADLEEFPWASSIAPTVIDEMLKPNQFICDNYHILRETLLCSDLVAICSSAFVATQLKEGSLRQIYIEGLPLAPTSIYYTYLNGRTISPLAQDAVKRVKGFLSEGAEN